MDVISLSALRTGSVVWQPRRGAWVMTAVCKATYALAPTESPLAAEQEYPSEDDNHWNDDEARSLYSPSDLVPFKPRADVMLVGHAFAPRGEGVRSLITRILVGEADKAIEVFGERSFAPDGSLRDGPRFVRVPMRWERAAGGPDTRNPVGMRLDSRPDTFGMVPLPSLQRPGLIIAHAHDSIEPIGFGPIAWSWPERREKLGRYAATWSPETWTRQPLPEDLDPSFFNAAPRDQQIDALRANERIVLENLHPDHPRLVTNLPGVSPRAFVERRGSAPQEVQLVADTLWIDTDRGLCTLTWRAQIPLDHPTQPGRVLVALAQPGQRLTWADVERLALEQEQEISDQKTPPPPAPPRETPFVAVPPPEPSAPSRPGPSFLSSASVGAPELAPRTAPPEAPRSRRGVSDPLGQTHDDVIPALAAALPFGGDAMPPWLTQSRMAALNLPLGPSLGAPPAPPSAPTFSAPPLPAPPRPAPTFGPPPSTPPAALPLPLQAAPPSPAALPLPAASHASAAPHVPAALPPAPPTLPKLAAVPPPRKSSGRPRTIVDLLWFDPAALPRLRATWKATLESSRPRPPGGDDEERRAAAAVLARVQPLENEELSDAVAEAVDDDGAFTPPLVIVGGELVLPLDGGGEPEHILLAQRRYQRRIVFGGASIAALLLPGGASAVGIPAYLPEAVGARLPLLQRFPARLVAEAHLAQDAHEASPVALRVVAIARAVPFEMIRRA